MNDREAQRMIAHLELARTAIDNAECRIVGAIQNERPGLLLIKACAEISAASSNLALCAEAIGSYAQKVVENSENAPTTDRAAAGSSVAPGEKTGRD